KNLWHCNDHVKGDTVVGWLMLEEKITSAEAMRKLGGGQNGQVKTSKRQIVATYDYIDEAGKLLFQCVRYEPKEFKQRRPDGNEWIWNIKGTRRVLYWLPEVLKAETVCLTEGEKDADNLRELGFTATTNPLGAGKWRDEYAEVLRGKDTVVF